jgi:hypothetical protein
MLSPHLDLQLRERPQQPLGKFANSIAPDVMQVRRLIIVMRRRRKSLHDPVKIMMVFQSDGLVDKFKPSRQMLTPGAALRPGQVPR